MIFGAWADEGKADRSALTPNRAFPYDGARKELSGHSAYAKFCSRFAAVIPATLRALSIDPARVAGLRITRWDHALPLAANGLLASGPLERASGTHAECVFFAQQDSWANPCVESAYQVATNAAEKARQFC